VKVVAAKRVDLNRKAVGVLDDTYYIWPTPVAAQLPHIRSSYMAELATLDTIVQASSYNDAHYATWPAATPEQHAAGQEIRYQLGLDSDATASCLGHETGLDSLVAAQAERTTALSK